MNKAGALYTYKATVIANKPTRRFPLKINKKGKAIF
jgi:hypothetical protein